mgnify:CR=1 FL=1
MEVKDRKDIDVKDTWNLESIYANNELWEEEYAALENGSSRICKVKGGQLKQTLVKNSGSSRCLLWTASLFEQVECLCKNAF